MSFTQFKFIPIICFYSYNYICTRPLLTNTFMSSQDILYLIVLLWISQLKTNISPTFDLYTINHAIIHSYFLFLLKLSLYASISISFLYTHPFINLNIIAFLFFSSTLKLMSNLNWTYHSYFMYLPISYWYTSIYNVLISISI